jgi:peptidoglycan/LPS O-acetylase OafA/YrhL
LRVSRWVFPIGAILNVGGVFLYALLERHSFENTQDWEFAVLSATFIPSLLVGTVLVIVGSFLDRRRLPVAQARVRGVLCWLTSGISFALLASIGNVHGWTFAFIFPAFAGFVTGAVLLSKLTDRGPE